MVLGRLAVSLRKSNKIDYPLVEICIKMGKHERHKKKNANTLETEATADRCDTDPWFKAFEMLRSTLTKITCSSL